MKKLTFIFIISIFLNVKAEFQQEKFLQANLIFKKGNIQQALNLYENIEPKNACVWFNIGSCNFVLGDYIKSIWAWEKAKKNGLNKKYNIKKNIDDAYKMLNYNYSESLLDKINNLLSYLSLLSLQLIFFLFWFITYPIILRCFRLSYYFFALSLVLFNVAILSGVSLRINRFYQINAIVKNDNLNVLLGPDEKYHKIGSLNKGDKVTIYLKDKNWYKIKHRNIIGWASEENFYLI